jgi:enoyl-CoA hydratase
MSSGSSTHAGNGFPEAEKAEGRGRNPVGLHVAGGVAVISLRRPDKMNAINSEMWETVSELVHRVSKDEKVRVLVLRGEGENFSTGSDLKELGESDLARVEDIFHRAEECAAALEESPLPTIACIRGYTLGTGLLMALACDMRVAEQNATVGIPIARLGITLSETFVRRVAVLTGPAKMKELVYTGRLLDGEEAMCLGLVNRVVPQNESVLRETLQISRVIRQQSPASMLAAKRWGGSASGRVPTAYDHVDPDDFSEGVRAFLEHRPPRFYEAEDQREVQET